MTLTVGTLSGVIDLDSNPFEKSLDRTMRTGAQKASDMGDKMTKRVTLPLIAAGGAALKMGVDFDTSMSRMVGLVGLTTDEVADLRTGIMDLSGETAKSPQELADAMFTVTSAGFRGAEAMDVLTMAAKASAAGLGETRTIAEALTGAINAYGPEVLDAARATDILVATARAGNFESSQLAGVLGKITPFAKQAGASLEDVGGSIALLTRVNNNATESGTQVAAMLRAFVVPTEEAKKELDKLYGSTQAFRDIIQRDGLVAALQDLDGKLGGNREQLGKILGSSEAASAAFQILEADAETLSGTFGTVEDSAGMADEAFLAWAGTSGATLGKALADLQIALIEAGSTIAPFVATVAGGLGDVAAAFAALPGEVQTGLLIFAGLAAAMGPVLSIAGRIVTAFKAMQKAAATSWAVMKGGGPIFLGIAAAVGIAITAAKAFETRLDNLDAVMDNLSGSTTDALVAAFRDFDGTFKDVFGSTAAAEKQLEFFRLTAEENVATARRLRNELKAQGEDVTELDRILREAATAERQLAADTDAAAGAVDEFAGEVDGAVPSIDGFAGANEEAADPVQELAESIKAVTEAVRAQFDPLFAAQDAMLDHRDAQEAVTEAQAKVWASTQTLNGAIKEHGRESEEAMKAAQELSEAERDLEEKQRAVVRSAMNVTTATFELKRMMEEGELSTEGAKNMLNQWVAQGLLTEEQARLAAQELGFVAAAARESDDIEVMIPVGLDASSFYASLANLQNTIAGISQQAATTLILRDQALAGRRHEGGRVSPDMAYLTGTYGHEELFVPDSAGTVFSQSETGNMVRGGAGSGGDGEGVTVLESTIKLDGRKIGSSRSVIDGMDTAKAKRSQNTGGRG